MTKKERELSIALTKAKNENTRLEDRIERKEFSEKTLRNSRSRLIESLQKLGKDYRSEVARNHHSMGKIEGLKEAIELFSRGSK